MTVEYFTGTASTKGIRKNDAVYADAHDAADGESISLTGVARNSFESGTSQYFMSRGFLFFPTSGLPDGATITVARIRLGVVSRTENDSGHADIHIVEGVQNDPLILSDFGAHLSKTTSLGNISFSEIGGSGTRFWIELNATGLALINKTGTTKFCVRLSGDIDNTQPTGINEFNPGENTSTDPRCTTNAATDITNTTATLNGTFDGRRPPVLEVTYTGAEGTYPRSRFQYGLTASYGTNTAWQGGLLLGETFLQAITGLSLNTLYHFRAQSENADGTYEGADATFTTLETVVTTQTCENVADTTATGRGTIVTLGSPTPTAHGHCWAETVDPTTSDSSVDNGAASATGAFTSAITRLTPGTAYYTRAYATNAVGTAYGANVYFIASTDRAGYVWMEGQHFHGFNENAIEITMEDQDNARILNYIGM